MLSESTEFANAAMLPCNAPICDDGSRPQTVNFAPAETNRAATYYIRISTVKEIDVPTLLTPLPDSRIKARLFLCVRFVSRTLQLKQTWFPKMRALSD